MLKLIIEGDESFNEETSTFETFDSVVIELEHSLISLSKWESKYQKPFLSSTEKTTEEIFGYLQAMIITPDMDPDIMYRCSQNDITKIQQYIDSSESATTFGTMPERRGPGEVITSELIYYWLVAFNIPFECQYWHLNRLFSLIRICNIKNSKPTKMSRHEIAQRNQELNARRRAELNTPG
jgi:hypothetical protein